MTALRVRPSDFGYPPAREARAQSEQAFERGVAASCAFMGALFALSFALRALLPSGVAAPPAGPRAYDLGDFRPQAWTPERPAAPVARPRTAGTVPLPVPEAAAAPEATVSTGSGAAGEGASDPHAGGASGGEGDFAGGGSAVPEPGVWQYVEQQPEVAVRVAPEYPDLAREAQVEGTVMLWALVDLDGRVREVRVQRSVPLLDGAARAAVERWRFTPALANGRPVRVWVAVPVRFSLH